MQLILLLFAVDKRLNVCLETIAGNDLIQQRACQVSKRFYLSSPTRSTP